MKKKLYAFQLSFILIFIIFLITILIPKNYTKEYKVKDVTVIESYDKENKNYYFLFKYQNKTLDYLVNSNYKQHRKFIKDIKIIKDKKNFCLTIKGDNFNFIPLCYQNEQVVSFKIVNKNLKEKLDQKLFPKEKIITTYNDIEIYNQDYKYLLWNYDGMNYLSEEENKKIKIFSKELYNINLVGYTKDYLVIADYDNNYTFNRFYTIDFKKGNLKKHDLNYDIYFDSYYLGHKNNEIYIVDNKEQKMYEFDAKKGELNKYRSSIYNRGEWEKVGIKTLINKNKQFTYLTNYNYEVNDNNLYLNYFDKNIKTLVSENITSLIHTEDKDVFYLKKDTLYHFNPEVGEEKLLTYFEWNFNYENTIFIN